jgi:dTDP-glucose 4,6-dehydratase
LILAEFGRDESLIDYVTDRPGHDRRYAIDNTKIASELAWSPSYTFERGIAETIRWYSDNTQWMDNVISGNYLAYYASMYENR